MNTEKYLDGKRVLFLGFQHYDYHIHIRNALVKAGAIVTYYSVEKYWFPHNLIYTFLRNTNKTLWLNYNKAYSNSILKQTGNEIFDYVFVIQGFQHSGEFYTQLRRQNPKAIFLSYQWDPVRDTVFGNSYLDIVPFFDKVYSFDKKDVETYDNLYYLPLFYSDAYGQLVNCSDAVEQDIDLLFIGTLWEMRRYDYFNRVQHLCIANNLKFVHYLRCSWQTYTRSLLKGRILRNVHLKSLMQNRILAYYKRAKVIIDLPHLYQTGLTMRVFEVLGAGRRLITTNKNIQQEPFYDKQYISVMDSDRMELDLDFIRNATIQRSKKIESYSISNWLRRLFHLS